LSRSLRMSTRRQGMQQTVEGGVKRRGVLPGSYPSDIVQMEDTLSRQIFEAVDDLWPGDIDVVRVGSQDFEEGDIKVAEVHTRHIRPLDKRHRIHTLRRPPHRRERRSHWYLRGEAELVRSQPSRRTDATITGLQPGDSNGVGTGWAEPTGSSLPIHARSHANKIRPLPGKSGKRHMHRGPRRTANVPRSQEGSRGGSIDGVGD